VGEFYVQTMAGAGDLVDTRGLVETQAAADRSAGFHGALTSHPRMRLMDECSGLWFFEQAPRAFGQILSRQPRIDGVFAHNDEMASGAFGGGAQHGLRDASVSVGLRVVLAAPASYSARARSEVRMVFEILWCA
jgi:ABC-type sugar transport system substrate-binding protein